jgi:hypothetical protein
MINRYIKINFSTKEQRNERLEEVLNLITLICHKGYIPNDLNIEEKDIRGQWWIVDDRDSKKFNIIGASNNNWATIRRETSNMVILDYVTRYDIEFEKEKAVKQLLAAFFDYVEIVDIVV